MDRNTLNPYQPTAGPKVSPKVSIVIPAFNEAKYIGDTLRNLEKLDYPDYEIIVVDNASSDGTGDAARAFPFAKVLVEPIKGSQSARECGRRAAKGEIIACLDADCLAPRDWLSRGVKYFENPEVVALGGPYDYYDTGPVFRSVTLFVQKYIYRITNFICRHLKIGGVLIGGNCLLRNDILNKMGGFDTSIHFYGDDTDTAKRMSKYGKVVFDGNFILKSSGRRFKNEGLPRVLYNYGYYFFATIILSGKEGKNK